MKLIRQYLFGCLLSLLVCLLAAPSWAAISFVGKKCNGLAGTTSPQVITLDSLTGGSDATPQIGDFVIGAWGIGANGDITLIIDRPGGTDYTQFGTEQFADDTEDTNLRVGYAVMPNPVDADITFTTSVGGGTGDVTRGGTWCVYVFRGVHATPLEQAVQQGTAANTLVVNPGDMTPTTPGTWIVVIGAGASTNLAAGYTSSDLTNFSGVSGTDGHAIQMGMGYLEWTSGTFSPATFGGGTTDSTNYSYAWKIIALAPAEAPASPVEAGNAGAIMLLLGR